MRAIRRAVAIVAVLVLGLVLAVAGAFAYLWSTAKIDTVGDVTFATPLAVPPLAESRIDDDGRRVFDLDLQVGSHEFIPGKPASTWGVNQDYLGQTLRASRGETVLINVRNGLPTETSLHWHGMHLPARMDGGPHQPIAPGQTWSPTWTVDQPAASLWYHPHLHGRTAQHVYRGVAGMFIVDDEEAAGLGLPDEYGVDDIPVILQDKRLNSDGQLDAGQDLFSPTGQLGDTMAVNGVVDPYLDVSTERVRLRVLNASNARIYNLGLDDDRSFQLIASDGGLLGAPYETTRLQLSPGERAEIVVTMSTGERAVLRSYPADLGADFFNQRFAGGDDTFDLLELRAAGTLAESDPVPPALSELSELPDPAAVRTTRSIELSNATSLDGKRMDLSRIDHVVTVGDTEVWEVTNADGAPHSFHIHDVQFRVLDIDGAPPPPPLLGSKDTIYLAPGTTARLVLRFTDYTDPDFPYMYHCHLLGHEDDGMMGQFVVVEPGQAPGTPPAHSGHGG